MELVGRSSIENVRPFQIHVLAAGGLEKYPNYWTDWSSVDTNICWVHSVCMSIAGYSVTEVRVKCNFLFNCLSWCGYVWQEREIILEEVIGTFVVIFFRWRMPYGGGVAVIFAKTKAIRLPRLLSKANPPNIVGDCIDISTWFSMYAYTAGQYFQLLRDKNESAVED